MICCLSNFTAVIALYNGPQEVLKLLAYVGFGCVFRERFELGDKI